MGLNIILAGLAAVSLVVLIWQWVVARKFPLHRRNSDISFAPPLTVLKPLKGSDLFTEDCLRSWFSQQYDGDVQILFGVASEDDPVCAVVRKLMREFPDTTAELIICGPLIGPNAKVSKLIELEKKAASEILILSDADVRIPENFLRNLVASLKEPKIGLVNCFYQLANPVTIPMYWEAVAINADFWSQVLQARSLKPLNFALGAVMATRRTQVREIGGFELLGECLADDYQLGHRIARLGYRIELSTLVVKCWSDPQNWREVWKHQLRWARTIRVSEPAPYFFSILSNSTIWPLVWLLVKPSLLSLGFTIIAWSARIAMGLDLQNRLSDCPAASESSTLKERTATNGNKEVCGRSKTRGSWWVVPFKDLMQLLIWVGAFAGNHVEWRGERMKLLKDGRLQKLQK